MSAPSANKHTRANLPMRALSRSLPMALLKAREAAMERFRPLLRDHGLTEQQWRVVRVLAEVERIEISELAQRAVLLAPSLSRILRHLDREGLILRSPVAGDQRRACIALSDRGWHLFRAAAPASEGIYADIERRFGRARLDELLGLLERIEAALAAPAVTPVIRSDKQQDIEESC